MLKNITVNNIPFFSRIVIRFIILDCELFMTRIQDFATGMYAETKEEAIALYKRVPRLLKDKVEQILIESGCEDLIKESEEQ